MSQDPKDVNNAEADRTLAAEKPADGTENADNAEVALSDDALRGIAGAGMYWDANDASSGG